MKLEDVTAEIRPRSDVEAVDLGFALARRDFWPCFSAWWLGMGPLIFVAGILLWNHPGWFLVIVWWFKTVGMRLVLFRLSRSLFGERPGWRAVLWEIPRAWKRRFFYRLILCRLSPWLPVALPVEDLEALRGKEYQRRCEQISRRGGAQAQMLYFTGHVAIEWIALSLILLAYSFLPMGQEGWWETMREAYDPAHPMEVPLGVTRFVVAFFLPAMALVDVFVTGAGFGLYLNNRTWIEGWDVELAFRRLAKRLSGAS